MGYTIKDVISNKYVPQWGNQKKFIAIHYLGVVGQNHELQADGCGAHFYIYWDGTIYQRCSLDAIVWAVGTAGYYTQKHPQARNANTVSIEMCCKCDGNAASAEDKRWYFTTETQEACVWLVKKLMEEQGIPAGNVLRHFDIVNKTCPAPYVHNNKYRTSWTWDEFRARIGAGAPEADARQLYRVRKAWADAQSQVGAYAELENAKKACLPGYSVYDEDGKQVYSVEARGFQTAELDGLTEAQRIERIAPLYQECMRKTGMLASVGLAQFCLESGYGTTDLAELANNLHGMKCELSGNTWGGSAWDGVSKHTKQTKEQTASGQEYTVTADFRKYPCCEDSIADRAAYFIGAMNGSRKRYPDINKQTDYKKAIQIIKDGGYATDINYVSKLVSLVERWGLLKYDEGIETPSDTGGDILPETGEPWYRVRKSWGTTMDGQVGAYHDLGKAREKADENPGYKVFDEAGNAVYESAGQESATPAKEAYVVQCGSFTDSRNADRLADRIKAAGFDATIKGEGGQYKVQCGVFGVKANADALVAKLKAAGFEAIIKAT